MIENPSATPYAPASRKAIRFAPAVRVSMAQHVPDQLLAELCEALRGLIPKELCDLQQHRAAVKHEVGRPRSYFGPDTAFRKTVAAAAHNPVSSASISLLIGQVRGFVNA